MGLKSSTEWVLKWNQKQQQMIPLVEVRLWVEGTQGTIYEEFICYESSQVQAFKLIQHMKAEFKSGLGEYDD